MHACTTCDQKCIRVSRCILIVLCEMKLNFNWFWQKTVILIQTVWIVVQVIRFEPWKHVEKKSIGFNGDDTVDIYALNIWNIFNFTISEKFIWCIIKWIDIVSVRMRLFWNTWGSMMGDCLHPNFGYKILPQLDFIGCRISASEH